MKRALFGVLLAACSAAGADRPADRGVIVIEESRCYFGLQQVFFERGAAGVPADSSYAVESLAGPMIDDPATFAFVELSGHASSDEANALELSTRRANAVRHALVAMGVDASRMRAKGYGAFCPTREDPNDPGNRRVELKVVRSKQGDTGVELGCAAAAAAAVK